MSTTMFLLSVHVLLASLEMIASHLLHAPAVIVDRTECATIKDCVTACLDYLDLTATILSPVLMLLCTLKVRELLQLLLNSPSTLLLQPELTSLHWLLLDQQLLFHLLCSNTLSLSASLIMWMQTRLNKICKPMESLLELHLPMHQPQQLPLLSLLLLLSLQ